jgi:hypothetical protein
MPGACPICEQAIVNAKSELNPTYVYRTPKLVPTPRSASDVITIIRNMAGRGPNDTGWPQRVQEKLSQPWWGRSAPVKQSRESPGFDNCAVGGTELGPVFS